MLRFLAAWSLAVRRGYFFIFFGSVGMRIFASWWHASGFRQPWLRLGEFGGEMIWGASPVSGKFLDHGLDMQEVLR